MELELRHLRRLVVIADAGSESRAAEVLGLSRAALTGQLGRIESGVGEPLFNRSAGTLTPTTRGREVLELARGVLADMVELVAESRRDGSSTLRLVGPEYLLTPVAARFAAMRPEVLLSTRLTEAYGAVEALLAGTAEAAATVRWPHAEWPPAGRSGLRVHEVDRAPLQVLLPDTHRLAGVDLLDLIELSGETWCVRAEPALADAVVAECVRRGFEPDIRYRLDTDDAVEEMVAAGQAVALVAHVPPTRPGTVVRPYRGAALSGLVLVWRTDAVSPDLARQLVAAIEDWHASRSWAVPPDDGRRSLGSAARPLRIGSVAELAAIPTIPRLRTVHGLYSEIEFGTQQDLLSAMERGELDLALCQSLGIPPDDLPPSWPRRAVVEGEHIVVALSAGHRLAGGRLAPAYLAEAAWAVRSASGEAEMLRAIGIAAGFTPQIASTYTDPRQISAAVASGRLIRLADPLDLEQGVVRRIIDHPAARRTLLLLWRPDGEAGSVADLVAEELRLARVPYVTPYPAEWS